VTHMSTKSPWDELSGLAAEREAEKSMPIVEASDDGLIDAAVSRVRDAIERALKVGSIEKVRTHGRQTVTVTLYKDYLTGQIFNPIARAQFRMGVNATAVVAIIDGREFPTDTDGALDSIARALGPQFSASAGTLPPASIRIS
jgi:hypothetical protein